MSKCGGLHCPGCGNGGGGLAAAVIVAAVVIAATARPVLHAAAELLRVALITAGALAGLGIAGGITWLAVRSRRPLPAAPPPATLPPSRRPQVRPAPRRELAAPQIHLHVHGPVSAEDLAAIIERSRELPAAGQDR